MRADPLEHVWAKSADRPGEKGERLTAHTAHVLSRLAAWRDRLPGVTKQAERDDLWALAALAVQLHDVGKSAAGFQTMVRGGDSWGHRHEVLSLAAVGWLELDDDALALVTIGVGTHHLDVGEVFERYRSLEDREALLDAWSDEALVARVRAWVGDDAPIDVTRYGFERCARWGERTVKDGFDRAMRVLRHARTRLEEQEAHSAWSRAARAMRALVVLADHAGSAHERVRVHVEALASPTTVLRRALGDESKVWAHQRACASLRGHGVLVAPTGSGKTEAALAWASGARSEAGGQGIVGYVLPFRASLDAMRWRIAERYGVSEGDVVLQHSSSLASVLEGQMRRGYTLEEATRLAQRERALGALFSAPIRLSTPYQWLRWCFGFRGHEAAMVDSYGAAWVFDELHAYERERLGMILAMIEHARTVYDVRCLALSATMPTVLIDAFSRTVGGAAVLRADDETFARFARHRVQIDERSMDDEAVFDEVERRYRDGECILVVHNTVRAAMACFDHMRARVDHDDVLLLHSRFTADDRAGLERSLIERTATGRREGRRPCVVVATQTVEVSLDVDFDRLWTAPAPIEALVQRFGRCNRGRRAPTMDVHISAVIDDGTQAVYDFEIVRRTVELLRTMHGCTLDEGQVQRLVDELYEPVRERWMKDVKAATERFRRDVLETNRPLTTHDELVSLFDALFDGVEVVPEMMKDELERRSRDEPVRVRGLGVPISRQRYASLKRSGKVQRHRESKQWLVSLPYDPVRGLAEDWR